MCLCSNSCWAKYIVLSGFLCISWPAPGNKKQLLAGIVFPCLSLFIFCMSRIIFVYLSVTFCCGTLKLLMPLPHQCRSHHGCDWSLDNFPCLPYSSSLFLSILETGQSLWKWFRLNLRIGKEFTWFEEAQHSIGSLNNYF